MSFDAYSQILWPKDHKYKLIELLDDLVDYIKDGKGDLVLKSPALIKSHLVLCTDSQTFTVRQMNHSNSMLLMNDMSINKLKKEYDGPDSSLVAIDRFSSIHELTKLGGFIDTAGIAKYPGDEVSSSKTMEQVEADSPIDREHFYAQWYNICGSQVDGHAVILTPEYVTKSLYALISVLLAGKKAEGEFGIDDFLNSPVSSGLELQPSIISTLAHRFGDAVPLEKFTLNHEKCAWWFGIDTMRKASSVALTNKDFMLKWKLSLPPFFNASLDLALLRGHFCRPETGKIRFLDPDMLSRDLHTRIKELFQMVKAWDYEDFLAYIEGFLPPAKKADAIILKFARKKRIAKNKFIVCPR